MNASAPGAAIAVENIVKRYGDFEAVKGVTFEVGDELGFEEFQRRLYDLGYHRTDVVAAAGEYAVRGGIVDVWAATAETPARIEFFGDEVESIRSFELASQRSTERLERLTIVAWSELARSEETRDRVLAGIAGTPATISAARAYLASGADIPEAWLPLAYDERATLLDHLDPAALVVLEEPALLATIERGLEDERSRSEHVLLAGVESGELSVDEDAVGEALLAEIEAPHPSLATLAPALAERRALVVPGAIEAEAGPWVPHALESFVLETQPAEHFNRQITMFLDQVKAWVASGETVALVASGASRLAEMLRAADLTVERSATLLHLRESGTASFVGSGPGMTRGGVVFVDQGSIEAGFAIPEICCLVCRQRIQLQLGAVYVTRGSMIKSAEYVQQGTLARSRLPHDRQHLPAPHLKRQILKEHKVRFAGPENLL